MAKNIKFELKPVGVTSVKSVGVPKTQAEKYDLMKKKNPAIEKLRDVFGLDVSL